MSQLSKPVWVWLPGYVQPVVCGEFTLKNGVGVFNYTDAYRALPQALALDPLHLPLTRSRRPFKETRQQGLFGVFRDASPEGFGLAMLERLRGQPLSDPLDRLEHAAGDGAGAIEVCDDLEAKLRFSPPPATALWDALAQLPTHRPSSLAPQAVWGATGTSLGGERPKMTVLHQGQPWIAKLQEQGDPSHAPLREYAAMRVALQLGVAMGGARLLAQGLWPSYLVAPCAAAATAGHLLGLDEGAMAHALSLALSQTGRSVGRSQGEWPGRWWLFGQAVQNGCQAAMAAQQGMQGDLGLLTPAWLQSVGGAGAVALADAKEKNKN